jgi:dolichol kinase
MISTTSEDLDVNAFSRHGSPSELILGPLQLNLLLVYLGLQHFMDMDSAITLAAVGIGDTLAPWVGAHFGRHIYRMPLGSLKTMEGSICGVFMGTILGSYMIIWFLDLPVLPLRILISYATVAAFAEASAPSNVDNIVISVTLLLSMKRIEELLPN